MPVVGLPKTVEMSINNLLMTSEVSSFKIAGNKNTTTVVLRFGNMAGGDTGLANSVNENSVEETRVINTPTSHTSRWRRKSYGQQQRDFMRQRSYYSDKNSTQRTPFYQANLPSPPPVTPFSHAVGLSSSCPSLHEPEDVCSAQDPCAQPVSDTFQPTSMSCTQPELTPDLFDINQNTCMFTKSAACDTDKINTHSHVTDPDSDTETCSLRPPSSVVENNGPIENAVNTEVSHADSGIGSSLFEERLADFSESIKKAFRTELAGLYDPRARGVKGGSQESNNEVSGAGAGNDSQVDNDTSAKPTVFRDIERNQRQKCLTYENFMECHGNKFPGYVSGLFLRIKNNLMDTDRNTAFTKVVIDSYKGKRMLIAETDDIVIECDLDSYEFKRWFVNEAAVGRHELRRVRQLESMQGIDMDDQKHQDDMALAAASVLFTLKAVRNVLAK